MTQESPELRRLREELAIAKETATRCQATSNRDMNQRREVTQKLNEYVDRYKKIEEELTHARRKHPSPSHRFVALAEEFGELAEALLRYGQHHERTKKEARQLIVVAIRLLEEHDPTLPSGAELEGPK